MAATMDTITLPHLPQYRLFVALYPDVGNVEFLRKQLLDGNTDFEYAFLDASMIASRDHLLAACFRAVNDWRQDRLRSRNVHSEIVFALSPNNNISESFRRFGLSEKTQHVLAVKVAKADIQTADAGADANADAVTAPTTSPTYDNVAAHLDAHVTGSLRPFTDANLAALRNDAALRKIYKTVDVASIMGSMAIKGS